MHDSRSDAVLRPPPFDVYVLDEGVQDRLAIEIGPSPPAERVIRVLEQVVSTHFVNKQQMQWTPGGGSRISLDSTRVLNAA
jgi:hypothetical protein